MNFIVIPNDLPANVQAGVRNLVLIIKDNTEISLPTKNVGIEMTVMRFF